MSFYVCMLPTEIQETIHMLFITMWATGFTPKAWKISNTNRQKQRRWNGDVFLSPNWLSKYSLQTMDASHHKYSLWICRSKLHTQHHTSWLSQTKKTHSPARKRDYGTRRCQTLSQRHPCPYCGYLPQLSTPLTTIAHLCPTGNLKSLKCKQINLPFTQSGPD